MLTMMLQQINSVQLDVQTLREEGSGLEDGDEEMEDAEEVAEAENQRKWVDKSITEVRKVVENCQKEAKGHSHVCQRAKGSTEKSAVRV